MTQLVNVSGYIRVLNTAQPLNWTDARDSTVAAAQAAGAATAMMTGWNPPQNPWKITGLLSALNTCMNNDPSVTTITNRDLLTTREWSLTPISRQGYCNYDNFSTSDTNNSQLTSVLSANQMTTPGMITLSPTRAFMFGVTPVYGYHGIAESDMITTPGALQAGQDKAAMSTLIIEVPTTGQPSPELRHRCSVS